MNTGIASALVTDTGGSVGFAAGVGVAAFFSPCAYALLPGYVGYYVSATEDERPELAGMLARGGAAVIGVLITFAAIAGVAVVAGDRLQSGLPVLEVGVGVILVVLGLMTLAGVDLGGGVRLPERRTSVVGFGAFGAMYALAAAGCVSPLVIAVAVQSFTLSPIRTLLTFAALAGTFAVLLLGTTVLVAFGHDAAVHRFSGYSRPLTRIAGVVLVVAGVIQIWLVI